MKETDITKPLIRWLDAQQWEIYKEVQLEYGGKIADIVATQGPLIWVIEAKTSLTASVIEQALSWDYQAHYVSVATPHLHRKSKGRFILEQFMRWKGIGWLKVESGRYGESVDEAIPSRLHRKAIVRDIREGLCEAQKTFAEAGNPDGKRWSPFQETAKRVVAEVRRNPGCDLKFLVDAVNHHYSSTQGFKTHIAGHIRSGVIKGIRTEQDGRKLKFYPEEQSA